MHKKILNICPSRRGITKLFHVKLGEKKKNKVIMWPRDYSRQNCIQKAIQKLSKGLRNPNATEGIYKFLNLLLELDVSFFANQSDFRVSIKEKKKVPSPQPTAKQTQTKFFASHVQINICIPCHLVYISKATEWCSSSKSLSTAKLKSFSAFRCVYIQTE